MPSAAVVGLGLMGGSLGLALRRAGWRVTGSDRDAAVTDRAAEIGAIDAVDTAVAGGDLIVLAVPVLAMADLLGRLGREAPGALVTDLCSTKRDVVAWAHQAGVDFVGGHPLCGREASGIEAARADLFQGAPWALTRPDPLVEEMVVAAGARPLIVEPEEHDRLVAGSSHAAFMLSAAYMLAASRSPDWPAMAALTAGGFRDMTRLAAGEAGMYAGIGVTNAENIRDSVASVAAALTELVSLLDGDPGVLQAAFAEARAARLEWETGR